MVVSYSSGKIGKQMFEELCLGSAERTTLVSHLNELPCGISNRFMALWLHLADSPYTKLISANTKAVKYSFYEALRDLL